MLRSLAACALRSGFVGSTAQLVRGAPRQKQQLVRPQRNLTCSPIAMGR